MNLARYARAAIWAFALAAELASGAAAQEPPSATLVRSSESSGAAGQPVSAAADLTPFHVGGDHLPFEAGVIAQGGVGLTEERNDFKFVMAGVHAGKVLYRNQRPGLLHGNFEYAVEVFPYWQSYTPKFQRAKCVGVAGTDEIACSPLFNAGGTFSGVTLTPIILRWNFATGRRITPYAQAAGGVLWTNHKYPAFGQGPLNLANDGPGSDASVWNFTPQGGIGIHYFISPRRSLDFGVNAVHISSASLGDRNPGVNASLQFSVGYSFWK